jgi:uncharacterized protein YjbJ (UPF0337 family)
MDCSNTRSSSWNELEGKWKQMKGTVREKFGKLTDDDLQVIGGKKDQFLGKLQERYGISREQAQKDLDNWLQGQHQMEPRTTPPAVHRKRKRYALVHPAAPLPAASSSN